MAIAVTNDERAWMLVRGEHLWIVIPPITKDAGPKAKRP